MQDELLTLPLEFCFGLILVTFTSTTLNFEIKRLVARVVNIPVKAMWLDGNSCRAECNFPFACIGVSQLRVAAEAQPKGARTALSARNCRRERNTRTKLSALPEKSPPEATMLGDSTATEVRLRYVVTTEWC